MLPDCHLVRTAIPFSSRWNSLGVFHHSPSASLASFADMVSKSKGPPMLRPGAITVWPLIRHAHLKAGYVCTQRYGLMNTDAPHCRFKQLLRTQLEEYHDGSTAMHKNRSPQKQGRGNHAIGNRPESASTRGALPPSTHPTLGVSSRHQRFHRYALQRIFRPSLGSSRSD